MFLERVNSKLRIIIAKLRGVTISYKTTLKSGVEFHLNPHRLCIGRNAALDRYVTVILCTDKGDYPYAVEVGENVYINRFTVIDASCLIRIGAESMIGSHCYITDHDHSFQKFPPATKKGSLPLEGLPTIIEENVWIGSHVTVLKGVTIGKNSIIGAGSVVTKSIPPNVVAVGNPCKVLRQLNS